MVRVGKLADSSVPDQLPFNSGSDGEGEGEGAGDGDGAGGDVPPPQLRPSNPPNNNKCTTRTSFADKSTPALSLGLVLRRQRPDSVAR